MKKMITALTALSLAASMMTPIVSFAADLTLENTTGTTTLAKSYAESYTITIPAEVSMDEQAVSAELAVAATDVLLNDGDVLKVSVASDNDWNLVHASDSECKVAYELSATGDVLTIHSGDTEGSTELTATVTGTPSKAGTFSDTLTFSVDVSAAAE